MNVASPELCKELYELSNGHWNDTAWWHTQMHPKTPWGLSPAPISSQPGGNIPAYSLGYLLRKLPPCVIYKSADGWYRARYFTEGKLKHSFKEDSSENATTKLAIELFKQGILAKELPNDHTN